MKKQMTIGKIILCCAVISFALGHSLAAEAHWEVLEGCRADWNGDGVLNEDDVSTTDPYGGYYYEWMILVNYPEYYDYFFPEGDPERVDWNGDGVIDDDDLNGTLSLELPTEGFYWTYWILIYHDILMGPTDYYAYIADENCL